MKHLKTTVLLFAVTAMTMLSSGCKNYDDDIDGLKTDVTDLKGRVSNLESQATKINSNLEKLSVLATAVEKNFYITEVKTTADGYELTLSNGRKITLQNGADNTLGMASSPNVTMIQLDGVYYWTIDGMLIPGSDGKPMQATGQAPKVRFNSVTNKWEISTNGGVSYTEVNLIPVSIMTYRAQMGAANPSDVFLPILLSTFFSTIAGIVSISFFQKVKLKDPVTVLWLGGLTAAVMGLMFYFSHLTAEAIGTTSLFISGLALFAVIVVFLGLAVYKKVQAYEAFVEGAKDGFHTAVMIIPNLVAILVGVAVFRASGAMDLLLNGVSWVLGLFGAGNDVVPALPTALMKPLSGGGARGMMIDAMKTFGPDSFAGRLSCMFQGATDTTFYIIAVYFGSVGIKKTRHAITCALISDAVGILSAIAIAYLFFPPTA